MPIWLAAIVLYLLAIILFAALVGTLFLVAALLTGRSRSPVADPRPRPRPLRLRRRRWPARTRR